MTSEQVKYLIDLPEGPSLDFKAAPYALSTGKEYEKAKLIKDILAFANTKRDRDAFILIGVEETSSGRGKIVGITECLPDHDIQQLVNEKCNRAIHFGCETVEVDGKIINAIRIAQSQSVPIYLREDYGSLRRNTIYVRRGSSTGEATPDEIARMNRIPISRVTSKGGDPVLQQLATRWLSIFENHAIRRTQIPLVLKRSDLVPAMFNNWRSTLEILADDIIDQTCDLFNIQRSWLEGSSSHPYDPVQFDKGLKAVIAAMVKMRRRSDDAAILAIKSGDKGLEADAKQTVAVVLRAEIMELNHCDIYSYLPLYPEWEWSNPEGRWYLKAVFLCAHYLDMNFWGYDQSYKTVVSVAAGQMMGNLPVEKPRHAMWHPDDFIYDSSESGVAKETKDLTAFRAFCADREWLARFREARKQIPNLQGEPGRLRDL